MLTRNEPWYRSIVSTYRNAKALHIAKQLQEILKKQSKTIPVIVISYNNGIYIQNTVSQLERYKITPIIIDNNSDDIGTLNILHQLEKNEKANIVFSKKNLGHMVGFLDPVYKILPNIFAYTDPDLQFNQNLPPDFLRSLSDLTIEYSVYKAGFALDLLADEPIIDTKHIFRRTKPFLWNKKLNLREIEQQYWNKKLCHKELEIYSAKIDTTFAVYNKEKFNGDFYDGVRVGGLYSAIHLPWFKKLDIMSLSERRAYLHKNKSTTSF